MKVLSLSLVAGLAVSSAFAETWYYMAPDTTTTYGLQKCNSWTNSAGTYPTGSDGTYTPKAGDVHYLYGRCQDGTKDAPMTARNLNAGFAGTLYLGTVDPNVAEGDRQGFILNKYYAKTTYGRLVWVCGGYRAVSSGSDKDNRAKIAGPVTVEAPASAPFLLCPGSKQNDLGFLISSDISGAAGTAFKYTGTLRHTSYKDHPYSDLTLSGDNSGYHGQILFAGGFDNPLVDMDEWQVVVDSPTALGGSCPEPQADALDVNFRGTARFVFTPNVGARIAAQNRGLTTAHLSQFQSVPNGALYFETQEGVDVDFTLPITGTTPVCKTGPGRLTLSGTYTSTGALTCEEGELCLASASAVDGYSGTVGGAVEIRPASAETMTVSGKTFDGARIATRIVNGAASSVELSSDCVLTEKRTMLSLMPDDSVYAMEKICLIKIPTAVKTVTTADFDIDLSALPYGLPRYETAVEVSDGVQSVVLTRKFPVVFRADGAPTTPEGTTWATDKDKDGVAIWTDGNAVHPGADYALTNGYGMREVSGSSFTGESVTFANESALFIKTSDVTLDRITLASGGCVMMGTVSATQRANRTPQRVRGNICITGTAQNPSLVVSRSDGPCALFAKLQGTGVVQFRNGTDVGNGLTILKSSQSDFAGRMAVNGKEYRSSTHTLQVEAAEDPVGGPLAAFDYRALAMTDATTLWTTNAVTLSTANRGILVRDSVTFNVGSNATMTVNHPVTFNGTLTKSGNGTLWLGGRTWFENSTADGVTETPTANKNKLVVTEGELGGTPQAFSNLAVTVSGGALRLDPTIGGDCGMLPQSLTVSAATLDIAVSTEADAVEGALLTVDDATATALAGKVRVSDPAHPRHRIAYGFVAAKDLPGYQTLTMSYAKGGLAVIIR